MMQNITEYLLSAGLNSYIKRTPRGIMEVHTNMSSPSFSPLTLFLESLFEH